MLAGKTFKIFKGSGAADDLEHHRHCCVGLDVNPQQGTFGGWSEPSPGATEQMPECRSQVPSRPAVRAWSRLVKNRDEDVQNMHANGIQTS